ncbi:MAG: SUMF1/EgtB/PvdO family nonheme iron enzyme [Deltaproteobacteria bacterium]|nr:SUMF1/EgtB/PvdO family nonheme iron enzyme [Deltaproteobacteria bacterium]
MARMTLFVFLISMAIVACDCEGGDNDPCQPNPCTQSHKSVCTLDAEGQVSCSCDEGYFSQADGSCIDPCDPNPCSDPHKSLCSVDAQGQHACACDEGYFLQNDGTCVDPCEPNPCQEANKTQCSPDEAGQAVCRCDSGTLDFGDGLCVSPWLSVPGGSFDMGSPEGVGIPAEHPLHRVSVAAFELYRAEVTVAQYRLCVEAGACSLPAEVSRCNYGEAERDDHPINCVNFQQAEQYCTWAEGRLPSEAEWEFAARGVAGRSYPWGEQFPDCGLAVLDDPNGGGKGCGDNSTAQICSKEAGHSELGFCDLGGNVYEWVADVFHDSYDDAPTDGSAWLEPAGDMRVRRGGSFDTGADTLRSAYRNAIMFNLPASSSGIRCARDAQTP